MNPFDARIVRILSCGRGDEDALAIPADFHAPSASDTVGCICPARAGGGLWSGTEDAIVTKAGMAEQKKNQTTSMGGGAGGGV